MVDIRPVRTADPPPANIHLSILHTSDLHGWLRGYDYLADKPSKTFGLSRTATLIRKIRNAQPNTLLFDTGDFLQGSVVSDLAAERGLTEDDVHPMIQAMNTLGYDALTPGNHDFNHGTAFLLHALKDAAFPVVSANFLRRAASQSNRAVFPPSVVLTRDFSDTAGTIHTLRIGVVGCLPPQTIDWDHALVESYMTACMLPATNQALEDLRTQDCDLTVLLAHTGIDPDASPDYPENALVDLTALDGLDVVLGGHSHRVFPGPKTAVPAHPAIDNASGRIHGIPVTVTGFGGNHLGRIDLKLSHAPDDGWQVESSATQLVPLAQRDALGHIVTTTPEEPDIVRQSDAAHERALRYIRQPVGETRRPLHSFFSLLSRDHSVALVAIAQAVHVGQALAGGPLADLPLLSAAAPFKTGRLGGPDHYTHIPAGPLSRRSVTDLYVYPNTVCAVRITGAQLREWLERSASLFSHLPPGTGPDTPLLSEHFPGYQFDVVSGLTYVIDPSQPPRYEPRRRRLNPEARRIRSLRYKNAPVRDDQEFVVATNSYRVYGTAFAAPRPEVVYETPKTNRDIVLDYIRNQTPLRLPSEPVWTFAPLGGVTALFETSPLARAYVGDPALPPLEDLGDTPEGFARFRVTL